MDGPNTPAAAEMLWWGLKWRHRMARLSPQGNFACRLTSGVLPSSILHSMLSGTDSVSRSPQNGVNNMRSGSERKPVSPPGLMNQDGLHLFPEDEEFCIVSLGLHKQNVCFNFLAPLISEFRGRTLSRGDIQI